jgi:hypothetical protein
VAKASSCYFFYMSQVCKKQKGGKGGGEVVDISHYYFWLQR